MKNFFKKFRSYSFWVSLSSAVIILLNAFGKVFGFSIQNQVVEDCIMAIAGILVVLGIVTMNKSDKTKDEQNEENSDENDDENSDNSDV